LLYEVGGFHSIQHGAGWSAFLGLICTDVAMLHSWTQFLIHTLGY